MTSWSTARQYTILEEQVTSGIMDVKQFNLSLLHQGATLAGSTYWKTDSDKPKVTSLASGFIILPVNYIPQLILSTASSLHEPLNLLQRMLLGFGCDVTISKKIHINISAQCLGLQC
ncbi:hypothetical protein EDD85DRAFT_791011 [Armillaria nabsnona]|nr:hypothetical protein EDD85DRAFT_791011 [Armillaria nabsnona]